MFTYWRSSLWLLIVSIFLLIPGNTLNEPRFITFENADKLVHFGLFWILQSLFLLEYQWKWQHKNRKVWVGSLLIFTGYAISTEFLQGWSAIERDPDWADGLADILGLLGALGCFPLISRWFPRTR